MDKLNNIASLGTVSMLPVKLLDKCTEIRSLMKSWGEMVLKLKNCEEFKNDPAEGQNPSEAIANIMLSYRHMEDARMRIGKVIQAMDGGISTYDK